jgi:hypothetical protein
MSTFILHPSELSSLSELSVSDEPEDEPSLCEVDDDEFDDDEPLDEDSKSSDEESEFSICWIRRYCKSFLQ